MGKCRLAGRAGRNIHTYPFGFAKFIILPPRTVETSDSICIDSPIPKKRKEGGMGMPLLRPQPRHGGGEEEGGGQAAISIPTPLVLRN